MIPNPNWFRLRSDALLMENAIKQAALTRKIQALAMLLRVYELCARNGNSPS